MICHNDSLHEIEIFVKEYSNYSSIVMNGDSAIKWYTRESFLYLFVNRLLRISKDPTCLYIIQPYFSSLFLSIK